MRKLLFICIFLFSCQKQKHLSTYIITLKYDEYHAGKYSPAVKIDTIKEKNDTVAFKKGFGRFSIEKLISKYLDSIEISTSKYLDSGRSKPMRRNISFKVADKNGKNVREKLSKHVIDSIENKIYKQSDQILKDLTENKNSN